MRPFSIIVTPPPLTDGEKIRDLAKQIRTREQFELIMAQVAPALQADVRGMLETLVVFDDDPTAG